MDFPDETCFYEVPSGIWSIFPDENEKVLFSATVGDHAAEGRVEVVCCSELVEGQVHAVAPVVARVGRHIDALVVRIAAAKGSVH